MHENKIGLYVAYGIGGAGAAICALSAPFLLPAVRRHCLPYVPATEVQLRNVLSVLGRGRASNVLKESLVLDVGSGDGRLVRAASRAGFNAHGVELNTCLIAYSRILSLLQRDGTKYYHADLWKFPLKPYSHIIIFGVEGMMADFETKLKKEAEAGTTVVACRFPLPNLVPKETIGKGVDTVWLYTVNKEDQLINKN